MADGIISRDQALTQGLKRYFTGSPCKKGHFAERRTSNHVCVTCSELANKQYRADNPDKVKAYIARWREENPEALRVHKRTYYRNNRDEILARCRAYNKANMAKVVARTTAYALRNKEATLRHKAKWRAANAAQQAAKRKARYKADPAFRAQLAMRRFIDRAAIAAKTGGSGGRIEVLGYSKHEFMSHIARQFRKGMSWDNHGEWHIDHIVPIAKLVAEGVRDPAVINALSNLRPIWASENLKKGAQVTNLI